MSPSLQSQIVSNIKGSVEEALRVTGGRTPVVLCSPQIRGIVRRMIDTVLPQVAVLSYNEIIRGIEVQSRGMVTLSDELANVSS